MDEVEKTLSEILAPTRELEEKLATRIEELEAELSETRLQRSKLKGVLRALDPIYAAQEQASKERKASDNKRLHVSDELVGRIEKWMRQNVDEVNGNGGVTATDLSREQAIGAAQSSCSKTLQVLHDRGVVRLDHRGRGGAKYYKLVA